MNNFYNYILIILLNLPTLAVADVNNNVWLTIVGGSIDPICRIIWKLYDQQYTETSVIIPKQGIDGVIAAKEMLLASSPKNFVCTGSSLVLYSDLTFKDVEFDINKVEMLLQFSKYPNILYVPNNSPASTFKEMIPYFKSLNRPINIGVYNGPGQGIAKFLNKEFNISINPIIFKNAPQMYPSIFDGSLDLMVDPGNAVSFAESGKAKIIGYSGTTHSDRLSKYENITKTAPQLGYFESWAGIAVPRSMPDDIKTTMINRLILIISTPEYKDAVKGFIKDDSTLAQPKLELLIKEQKRIIQRYWQ